MKPLDNYYVKFNKWNGKIFQVSSSPIPKTDPNCVYININTKIIQDIFSDKRSLESSYISYLPETDEYVTYTKTGVIYLFPPEKFFTEIQSVKKEETAPDVNLTLYTNNKLLDIEITLNGIKTWYNHRQGKDFLFAFNPEFIFQIVGTKNKVIKTITLKSHVFLENFKHTVDLSDVVDNLNNIKIKTLRYFKNYYLETKQFKYFDENDPDKKSNFNKADFKKKYENYDVTIHRTSVKNTVLIKNNINKEILTTLYKELNFYITGKDPNELYDILSIPIKQLWEKKNIILELKYEIKDKLLWINTPNVTVYFNNQKVINI